MQGWANVGLWVFLILKMLIIIAHDCPTPVITEGAIFVPAVKISKSGDFDKSFPAKHGAPAQPNNLLTTTTGNSMVTQLEN